MDEQLQLHRIARLISFNASTRHPIDFSISESRDTRTAFPRKYTICYIISRAGSHLTFDVSWQNSREERGQIFLSLRGTFPYVRFLRFVVGFGVLGILLVD